MKWARLASMSLFTTLVAACGAPPPPAPAATKEDAQQAAKQAAQQTVFGDSVKAMDKARAVEDVAAQRQRELQQAVEQAEGK